MRCARKPEGLIELDPIRNTPVPWSVDTVWSMRTVCGCLSPAPRLMDSPSESAQRLSSQTHEVTELLQRWSAGDERARDALVAAVYVELKSIARRHLRRERGDNSIAATGLVHEAYMRLIDQSRAQWQNRGHFFAIASQVVRRVLVDRGRARRAQKRGGGDVLLTLGGDEPEPLAFDVTALDDALNQLTELDARQGRLVELRFFGGLSIEETADVMSISTGTVKREWRMARAFLQRALSAER